MNIILKDSIAAMLVKGNFMCETTICLISPDTKFSQTN